MGVVGLGDGVFGAGLQLGLACVDVRHRRLGLGLVVGEVVGTGVVTQPEVAHQRLVLGQMAFDAGQRLAGVVHVLAQHIDVGATGLQVEAMQVLLVLACGIHMLLRGLQQCIALRHLCLQLCHALAPPLHALRCKPVR